MGRESCTEQGVMGRIFRACIVGIALFVLRSLLIRPVWNQSTKESKKTARIKHRKPLSHAFSCAAQRKIDLTVAESCLKLTSPNIQLVYPDDAEEHFEEIHIALAMFLQDENHKIHSAANFKGPWLENVWISHFEELYYGDNGPSSPCLFEIFGPFVPIFIPWVDLWVHNEWQYPEELPKLLRSVLRPNVPYITVSQSDDGFPGRSSLLTHESLPNLLVLSAGGYGHVPIPLIKQSEERRNDKIPVPERSLLLSYVGSLSHAPDELREKVNEQLEKWSMESSPQSPVKGELSYQYYYGEDWRDIMTDSRFSLTPRGFGRTAYHVVETWQMGLIPIQVYSDVPWMPYSNLLNEIAFVTDFAHLKETIAHLQSLSDEDIQLMEERIVSMRDSHFSMSGVMQQIQQFMTNQNSDLVCQELPETPRGVEFDSFE